MSQIFEGCRTPDQCGMAIYGGVEYMFPNTVKYTSTLFGNAEVRNEAMFLHLMLSRRW